MEHFEGMGAALWSWFLVGSEGYVRHWSLLAGCRFRISVPWCFAVWGSMFLEVVPSFSSMVFRCGEGCVLEACSTTSSSSTSRSSSSSRPSSCNRFVFTRIQKGRQASGQYVLGGRSVLQGHGVLLFRNRPLGLRCGAVLRGWELHFGAGFLLVQKATLGTGGRCPQARSVLQGHGVLLFRNRPLGLCCGAL